MLRHRLGAVQLEPALDGLVLRRRVEAGRRHALRAVRLMHGINLHRRGDVARRLGEVGTARPGVGDALSSPWPACSV